MHRLHNMMIDRVVRLTLTIPLDRMDLVALAHQEGKVLSEDYEQGVAEIQCVIPKRWESKFIVVCHAGEGDVRRGPLEKDPPMVVTGTSIRYSIFSFGGGASLRMEVLSWSGSGSTTSGFFTTVPSVSTGFARRTGCTEP